MTPSVKARDLLTRAEIDEIRRVSPLLGTWGILHAWLVVAGAMALFVRFPNPAVYVLCAAVVAGRQLGFGILMHDAAHGLLYRNRRWNDLVAQWFAAFPVKADIRSYRPYHLEHHRNTQRPEDPDLVLSAPFPVTRRSLARKALRDLTGLTGLKLIVGGLARSLRRPRAKRLSGPDAAPPAGKNQLNHAPRGDAGFLATNATLFAILWALGHPWLYVSLWLVPLLTILQLFTRIRSIAEHGMVPDDADDFRNTRTTLAGPLARIFVAPYRVNFHLEHHLFVFVPWYNLPKAHAMLLRKGHGPRMEIGPSYWNVLRRAGSAGIAR